MLSVPLRPIASQSVNVALDGQAATLVVYQKTHGLYMDLYSNAVLIIGGVRCRLAPRRVVLNTYFGFVGDFTWIDTQFDPAGGNQNPRYNEIGLRFFLMYLEASDLNGLG